MFIQIKNLTKIYNNYLAVNKINFKIEKNKTVGLLVLMVVEKQQQLE